MKKATAKKQKVIRSPAGRRYIQGPSGPSCWLLISRIKLLLVVFWLNNNNNNWLVGDDVVVASI